MKNQMKKLALATVTVVTTTSLASCSDPVATNVDVTTGGTTGTKEVRFEIQNPPKGFATANPTAIKPTVLTYSAVNVLDANGQKLSGDITTYCDLYYIDDKGQQIKAPSMAGVGTTHQNGDGYAVVKNCTQTVQIGVNVYFSINSNNYQGSLPVLAKVLKA